MLRRQSHFLSQEARYRVYVATIRPVIEYGCPVFGNAPSTYLRALDNIQSRAARLFPDLSVRLDPLQLRRDVAGLCMLYRIVDHSAPLLVREMIHPSFLKVTRSTRTNTALSLRALQIPRSRTHFHQQSFLPHYGRLWNMLDNDITFAEDVKTFKNRCCAKLRSSQR